MAVEIKRHHSKRLYRHATPIFLASVLVVGFSALILSHYSNFKEADPSQLGKAGTQSIVRITHKKNGLAKVDIVTESTPPKTAVTPKVGSSIGGAGSNVNQAMSLQVNFNEQ